jgi:hypothetical protein
MTAKKRSTTRTPRKHGRDNRCKPKDSTPARGCVCRPTDNPRDWCEIYRIENGHTLRGMSNEERARIESELDAQKPTPIAAAGFLMVPVELIPERYRAAVLQGNEVGAQIADVIAPALERRKELSALMRKKLSTPKGQADLAQSLIKLIVGAIEST